MSIPDEVKAAFIAAGLAEPIVVKHDETWLACVDQACVAAIGLDELTNAQRASRINNMMLTFKANTAKGSNGELPLDADAGS